MKHVKIATREGDFIFDISGKEGVRIGKGSRDKV